MTDAFDPADNLVLTGFGRPGFAEDYDAVRPGTPEVLVDLLCQYARVERPRLVVDLGCGTGLSTEPWAARAERVVGVEPLPEMLAVARGRLPPNVELVEAFAHETGLPDGSADVVVCVQSFHWMDPVPTLREVARILRPGGVFAAVDYDGPASLDWEVEQAAIRFREQARRLRDELDVHVGADEARTWPKEATWPRSRRAGASRTSRRPCCTPSVAAARSTTCSGRSTRSSTTSTSSTSAA